MFSITGLTGLAIIDAILGGERNPSTLAKLRHDRIKASEEVIAKSLAGDYRTEHLFTLRQSLVAYRNYQQLIDDCDREIRRALDDFQPPATPMRSSTDKLAPESKRKAVSADARLLTELNRVFSVDLAKIPGIRTGIARRHRCEWQRSRCCRPTLYAKRQENKLRAKAHALGFQLIPLENAG